MMVNNNQSGPFEFSQEQLQNYELNKNTSNHESVGTVPTFVVNHI